MSEELETGCHCNAGNAPCWWCESLSQEECDILDTYGYETLLFLQQNAFIINGAFEFETLDPDMREREFASAITVAQDSINLKKGRFTIGCLQAMRSAEALMESRPAPAATITRSGCLLPLHSATIHTLKAKRRSSKPEPFLSSALIIPFKRSP